MIKIGEQIPQIDLEAYQVIPGKGDMIRTIALGERTDKWLVLLFYPADFTFICPTELEQAAEAYEVFKKEGAEIMSVSTDTKWVHKAWHDESSAIGKVNFPMLADPTGRLCKALGTYIEEEGVSLRASFIFDPDLKLVAYEMHNNDIGRNIEEILRKLQAAKWVRDNHGAVVCPANWKPGGQTLKPGLNMVGKI